MRISPNRCWTCARRGLRNETPPMSAIKIIAVERRWAPRTRPTCSAHGRSDAQRTQLSRCRSASLGVLSCVSRLRRLSSTSQVRKRLFCCPLLLLRGLEHLAAGVRRWRSRGHHDQQASLSPLKVWLSVMPRIGTRNRTKIYNLSISLLIIIYINAFMPSGSISPS